MPFGHRPSGTGSIGASQQHWQTRPGFGCVLPWMIECRGYVSGAGGARGNPQETTGDLRQTSLRSSTEAFGAAQGTFDIQTFAPCLQFLRKRHAGHRPEPVAVTSSDLRGCVKRGAVECAASLSMTQESPVSHSPPGCWCSPCMATERKANQTAKATENACLAVL